MKRSSPMMAVVALVPLVSTACEPAERIGGPDTDTHFLATLDRGAGGEVRAGAVFRVLHDPRTGEPAIFSLRSFQPGHAETQVFSLHRLGGGRPEVGTYPVAAPGATGDGGAFQITYSQILDRVPAMYQAQEGKVEITLSTPDRVDGRFEILAVALTCEPVDPPPGGRALRGCTFTPNADPDAPALEISGTFSAAPVPTRRHGGMIRLHIPQAGTS